MKKACTAPPGRRCPPSAAAGVTRPYLGQHVLELLPRERQQEGADDPPQLALGHCHAAAGIEQLEGFYQLVSFVGNFLK